MRNVKGILIDPFACTITEVEHDGDDHTNIYKLLSHESMPVSTFQIVQLGDNGDAIFVDEEGLLKSCERFFLLKGYHQPLAGKGLVLGSDDEGDTQSAKATLAQIRKVIRFAEHVPGAGLIETGSPWAKPMFVIKHAFGDVYVAERPGKRSYTPNLASARKYETRDEAQSDLVSRIEVIEPYTKPA